MVSTAGLVSGISYLTRVIPDMIDNIIKQRSCAKSRQAILFCQVFTRKSKSLIGEGLRSTRATSASAWFAIKGLALQAVGAERLAFGFTERSFKEGL